jgi:hypothetical protein
MAGHRHQVRLGHRRNSPSLADAPAMGHIRLNDGDRTFLKQRAKLPSAHQPFTCGNRHGKGLLYFSEAVQIFRPARLLIPIQVVVNQHPAELDRCGRRRSRVQIEHDVDAVTDGTAHSFHALRRLLQRGSALDVFRHRDWHRLERREAFRDTLPRQLGEVLGLAGFIHALERSAAKVVVQAERVPNGSAQHFAHRLARFFTLDVPKCLIDSAERAHVDDSAAPEILPMHDLPAVLHSQWVLSDQQFGQVFDRAHDSARLPLQSRFAPAIQSVLVSLDLNQHPVPHTGVHHKSADCRNLHLYSSRIITDF